MELKFARIISILTQPLLIPTYGFILLFNINAFFSLVIPYNMKWMILFIIFIVTFVLPAMFIMILYRKGVVKSFHMETKEERIVPILITAVFYYLSYYLIKRLQISPIYYYFIIGTTATVVLALIINLFWKISLHMLAIGAMVGTFIGLSLVLMMNIPVIIMILFLIAGLIGFARLRMKAHSPAQIYTGFLSGMTLMLILFLFI